MHLTPVVTIGSANMQKANMMARVTLNLATEEGKDPLFEINNIIVRKSKDSDELWISMPAEKFTVTNDQGNEESRYKTIVKVAPKEGKRGGDKKTPMQDRWYEIIMKAYRTALAQATGNQTAANPNPVDAPADPGEPDF